MSVPWIDTNIKLVQKAKQFPQFFCLKYWDIEVQVQQKDDGEGFEWGELFQWSVLNFRNAILY
jgi:hypothetical protein